MEPEIPTPAREPIVEPTPEPAPTPDPAPEQSVPLSVVQAERQKRQALEQRLAEYEAEQKAADLAAAERRGEFEQLYGTEKQRAEELAARVAVFEEREATRLADLEASNTRRLKAIPAKLRTGLDGLPADTLAGLLPALEEAAGLGAAGGTRSRGDNRPAIDDATRRAAMHQYNGERAARYTADEWVEKYAELRPKRAS